MTAEELKAWFSAGREVLGFVRDCLTTAKELKDAKAMAKQKEENKGPDEK